MTKKEFVAKFAEKAATPTKADAERKVDAFLAVVQESLCAGENVQFVGWGTFEVKQTKERMGRNPKTGEAIKILAKKAVKFKVGKKLADKVNAK